MPFSLPEEIFDPSRARYAQKSKLGLKASNIDFCFLLYNRESLHFARKGSPEISSNVRLKDILTF